VGDAAAEVLGERLGAVLVGTVGRRAGGARKPTGRRSAS
jgi:hypothetical protein